MPSYFKNVTEPAVIGEIDVYSFLDEVEKPKPSRKEAVLKARGFYNEGNKNKYDSLKKQLPCVTLNFTFNDWKNNNNIIAPTGFIYIDLDGTTELDLTNPLIFSSWISLSAKGRGVLVRVNNLSLDNFKDTYEAISKELGIVSDNDAGKATQFNVISYDPEPYINNNSITYEAKEVIKATPTSLEYNIRERKDTYDLGGKHRVSYDNIHNIDFGDKDYIIFEDEKELIAKLWIPPVIHSGTRNNIISSICSQCKYLNPLMDSENFKRFILNINRSRCNPPLEDKEVLQIITKTEKSKITESIYDVERRVIFNPDTKLDKSQRRKITNQISGKIRSKSTLNELQEIINNWDFEEYGKITQVKLAKVSGRNIKTVEKYYKSLKK